MSERAGSPPPDENLVQYLLIWTVKRMRHDGYNTTEICEFISGRRKEFQEATTLELATSFLFDLPHSEYSGYVKPH